MLTMRPACLREHLQFVPSAVAPLWDGMLSRKRSAVGQWLDRSFEHRTIVKAFVLAVVMLQVMPRSSAP